jgi:glucose-1-phosphate thymidylyltransferase
MRKADDTASLSGDQAAAADEGVKGMIPIGRPFMDYLLTSIRDAGFERVCIVIGPEHSKVRDYYTRDSPPSTLKIEFAIQEKPLGTADAVLAAEKFAGGESFVVLNSDNYYPSSVLRRLRCTRPPGLVGFARSALIEGGVPSDRTTRFGALEIDDDGNLVSIMPRSGAPPVPGGEIYASMNCWLFDSRIFDVCRAVTVSPRGEHELPRAVQMAVDGQGMQFAVIRVAEPVLDLSTRADIGAVQAKLGGTEISY